MQCEGTETYSDNSIAGPTLQSMRVQGSKTKIAMSDQKISDAAKQLVASFVDDNAWNSLSAHWKETASRTAQGIINSEIDRIAGPLVKALQRVWDEDECGFLISGTDDKVECVKCGKFATDSSRIVHAEDCSQGFIDQALANYRKERGE